MDTSSDIPLLRYAVPIFDITTLPYIIKTMIIISHSLLTTPIFPGQTEVAV